MRKLLTHLFLRYAPSLLVHRTAFLYRLGLFYMLKPPFLKAMVWQKEAE